MDAKFFVPFETAMQLKAKGYPQAWATGYYDTFCGGDEYGKTKLLSDRESASCVVEGNTSTPYYARLQEFYVAAPTYHEVLDWLEEKGIRIEVRMAYHFRKKQWSWCGYVYIVEDEDYETSQLADWSSTREGALNAAILKALEMV